jgi:excisionase family DNA binding protein
MTDHEYLTVVEVADLLRTPVSTLYNWRLTGDGPPAARVGRRLLYKRTDVHAWVDGRVPAGGKA